MPPGSGRVVRPTIHRNLTVTIAGPLPSEHDQPRTRVRPTLEEVMGRRSALLIAAVIVALLGVVLVLLYVRGIDERAREGQETVDGPDRTGYDR
jgi:hypothetical protein